MTQLSKNIAALRMAITWNLVTDFLVLLMALVLWRRPLLALALVGFILVPGVRRLRWMLREYRVMLEHKRIAESIDPVALARELE